MKKISKFMVGIAAATAIAALASCGSKKSSSSKVYYSENLSSDLLILNVNQKNSKIDNMILTNTYKNCEVKPIYSKNKIEKALLTVFSAEGVETYIVEAGDKYQKLFNQTYLKVSNDDVYIYSAGYEYSVQKSGKVKDSSFIYAKTDKRICGFEAPIASLIGDQQAALFGQACFEQGEMKSTYGTGCFLLMNTGSKPIDSRHKLLTTIALGLDGKIQYALEGSVFIGGALIKWLRDELGIINSAHECDILAAQVKDSNGVLLVPAFTGLGAPYWDSYARGTIVGLTRGANKKHICRAALEAIAFQVKDEIECMKDDAGIEIASLKVDGGASVSDLMMQFQADILNTPVYRPENTETTVTGAAFLAGLAVGYWSSKKEIKKVWQINKIFTPAMEEAERSKLYAQWQKAVERSRNWE